MSPQAEATKVPAHMTITRRPTVHHTDELPVLRDRDGRALAVVAEWRPDATN